MVKEFENIIFSIDEDGIAIIKFNRPKSLNALCTPLNYDIMDALTYLERDTTVRVLIITGGEKVFAAGADITEMQTANSLHAYAVSMTAHSVNDRLEALMIPVIAAINGPALGGGFELSLACDFRIAGDDCLLGLPEVSLGIIPGGGGTQRLATLIGPSKAKEIAMFGKKLKGEEALALGVINRLVPAADVMEETMKFARKLALNPAAGLALCKMAINFGAENGETLGKVYERALFAVAFDTEDQTEGLTAFVEKRKPNYNHKR